MCSCAQEDSSATGRELICPGAALLAPEARRAQAIPTGTTGGNTARFAAQKQGNYRSPCNSPERALEGGPYPGNGHHAPPSPLPLLTPHPNGLQLLCHPTPAQFSRSVVSDSLRPRGLHHTRLPCPSTTPRACSNSCPSSQWCHPTISSSVIPFSSCLQSFPASGSFPMSQFFASGGQSISVSASVLPMSIRD